MERHYCYWCGKELRGWGLRYKDKVFCRDKYDRCIKDYLYDEADDLIKAESFWEPDYDMSEVDDNDM